MPTKRLNISIVVDKHINELQELRIYLESKTKKRLSMADVIGAVLENGYSVEEIVDNINNCH